MLGEAPPSVVYAHSMTKEDAVRFAVGSHEGPRSAVWRLWASGDHVYLSARLYGGTIKASLHKSGKWRWGFTEEYAAREDSLLPSGVDRALHKWERPPEIVPGITSAFDIVVPSTELTVPRHPLLDEVARRYLRKVRWVSPSSPNTETRFTVLLIAADSPMVVNNQVMWQHELPMGDTVTLIVYEQPMTDVNKEHLAREKRRILREVGKPAEGSALSGARDPRGYLLWDGEEGTTRLVDISLDFLFE
jgi:hypothetical protein